MDKGSQNGMDELEVIDADSQRVAAMLGALPRVEAPANFEFRVKAGIANGAPSRFGFTPFLKTAAPVALMAFVVSVGVLYYERSSETAPVNDMSMSGPAAPQSQSQSEPALATGAPESSTVANPIQETASTQREQATPTAKKVPRPQRNVGSSVDSDGGNSKVEILHPARVFMPKGTEAANPQKLNANPTANSVADTPVREVLGIFGIEGDFADGGWKVRSVKENSLGSKAKIGAGDVIESIDGQPVKNETKLKGGAKAFTVRRGGKLITLLSGN